MTLTPTRKPVALAPVVILCMLFVMVVLKYTFLSFWGHAPWLLTSAVFFFAVFLPKQLPVLAVVAVSFLEDGVSFAPFGLHGLVLVTMYHLARKQRSVLTDQPFVVCWMGFLICLFWCQALLALVMYVVDIPVTWDMLWQYIFTVVTFPAVFMVMRWVESKITRSVLS
jgi:hypothetical protein